MPRYRIEGTKRSTGRRNAQTVVALGADHARELAEEKGIHVEQCERQEEELPTERQVAYALSLGIAVSGISSVREMSSAISTRTGGDKPAHPAHVGVAEGLGIDTWAGIGKRELFNLMYQWFCRPGQEGRLCAWFAFRVYRHQCGNRSEIGEHGFPSPQFDCIGAALAAEPGMLASIQRAGRDAGPFVWFGSWKAPDGTVHQGNSKSSKAFKRAVELVPSEVGAGGRGSFQQMTTAARTLSGSDEPAQPAEPTPSSVVASSTARKCQRCGYEAQDVSSGPAADCRRCGANYAKVAVAVAQEHATIQAVKTRVAQARELKATTLASVETTGSWWRKLSGMFRPSQK